MDSLLSIYIEYIRKSTSPGIDGKNGKVFEKYLSDELKIIQRKVLSNSYRFSPYLCLLLIKGIDKYPRLIQKATIRDRIVLRIIYNVLNDEYNLSLKKRSLHSQIKELVELIKCKQFNYVAYTG